VTLIDYNGDGAWDVDAVIARYSVFASRFRLVPRDIRPPEDIEGGTVRRWPIMERVIRGIEAGDLACAEIGVEFIETDRSFPFGRILKPRTARALRRAKLASEQEDRIIRRVFEMLGRGYVPHEFYEYSRLARRIGFRRELIPPIDETHYFARKYRDYFLLCASDSLPDKAK
jgi:hypothetical protein